MSNVTQEWLEDPSSIRGILVEVAAKDLLGAYGTVGEEVTFYFSNIGYTTSTDPVTYLPYLTGTMQVTESLSIDNTLSMTFGDIQLANSNGDLDNWLDSTKFIWVNRPIQVYLGDPRWVCADLASIHTTFQKVFDGIVSDIDSSSRESINIKVADKLQRLNTALSEVTLGTYGTWAAGQTNQDTVRPLIFGEVSNISPLLIDPSTLEYMVSDGAIELILEVRDNGVPIYTDATVYSGNNNARPDGVTVNLTTGTFKLKSPAAGTITASVQGIKKGLDITGNVTSTYDNNIGKIVGLITRYYGKSATKLAATELDLTNINAFAAANTASIGTIITDRANVLNVCQEILASASAQLFINRLGLLQILQLGVVTPDTAVSITDDDILHHSLHISNKTTVVAATKIGYCKNYTVQKTLASGLPSVHSTMFGDEWYTTTVADTTVQSNYKLDIIPIQKDTGLINKIDADALALRLNNYFKIPKTVFSFTGTTKLWSLKLGQEVTLKHNRFGLTSGKSGQVISLSPNWMNGTINVEVLV